MNIKKREGKAAVVFILMLVFAAALYFILTMLVMDKQADAEGDVEEVDGIEVERNTVSVSRANQVIQKTKNTLKEQEKALDARLKKNLNP